MTEDPSKEDLEEIYHYFKSLSQMDEDDEIKTEDEEIKTSDDFESTDEYFKYLSQLDYEEDSNNKVDEFVEYLKDLVRSNKLNVSDLTNEKTTSLWLRYNRDKSYNTEKHGILKLNKEPSYPKEERPESRYYKVGPSTKFETIEEYEDYLKEFNSPKEVERRRIDFEQRLIEYKTRLWKYKRTLSYQLKKLEEQNFKDFKTETSELFSEMVKQSYEGREVDYERRSKQQRIDDSLMMMDDFDSFQLRMNIQKCRKYQHKRIKNKDQYYQPKLDPLNLRDNDGELHFTDGEQNQYLSSYIKSKDVCQSLWCPNCRKIVTKLYEKKIRDHLSCRLFPTDTPYTNFDLHHISGVVGVCSVSFDEVEKLIKKDDIIWRRIRRNVNKLHPQYSPFIESVYELELVNWVHLNSSSQSDFKKKQMFELIRHFKPNNNLILFVHFHSISNLSKDQIDEVFKDYYFIDGKPLIKTNKKNGLYVQKLKSTQPLDKNIEKLCSYPFKDPIRYKHSFKGSDYSNGEYFEFEELSSLMKIYQRFQKRSWRGLFRSVEHLTSKEFLKWKRLFPKDHRMWLDLKPNMFEDFRGISPTYVVNTNGDVFTEGWNPNNFFGSDGLKINSIQRDRKVVDRIYFPLWDFPMIIIYKNVYEFGDDVEVERDITLEELYYSKRYLKLKKDQYIKWTDSIFGRSYHKFFKDIDLGDVERLRFLKIKETNKDYLIDRLNTLLSLSENDQRSYVKKKVISQKGISHRELSKLSEIEVTKLLSDHICEEIEKVEGTFGLEKFMV